MEKYIEVTLQANIEGEGALTVDAKTFVDIARTIEDGYVDIMIDQQKDSLSIKSVYDSFSIKGISASEYVALPEMNTTQTIAIKSNILAKGIEKVEYAVTEKNFSPVFTGVLIRTKKEESGNKIIFVWTDSFRLAEYKVDYEGNLEEEMSLIIPKSSVNDFRSIAQFAHSSNNDGQVTIELAKNLVRCSFELETMTIKGTSLLIQGAFPDYDNEKIMPKEFTTNVEMSKSGCDKAIKKIGILTKDINNYISLDIKGNDITITSGETDKGDGATQLQGKTNGTDITLWLNGKHVTDFLRTIEGEEVLFNMINDQSPLILTETNESQYKYVIRPIHK